MFAGGWLGSFPATTWHFTHSALPNRTAPVATILGSMSASGSKGYGTRSREAK